MAADLTTCLATLPSIPGWFYPEDMALFQVLDRLARHRDVSGDILEIGAYAGRSSVLLGYMLTGDEKLIVCDPFEDPVDHTGNARENQRWYPGAARQGFEEVYRRYHNTLPIVHQCPSSDLTAADFSRRLRFIHIDGSHLYENVRYDIALSYDIIAGGGIIAIDDYRCLHTPGVAAAAWEVVAAASLRVICLSENKMYLSPIALTAEERIFLREQGAASGLSTGETLLAGATAVVFGSATQVQHLDAVGTAE